LADITAIPDSPSEQLDLPEIEAVPAEGLDATDSTEMPLDEAKDDNPPEGEEPAQDTFTQMIESTPDEKNDNHQGLKTLLDSIENPPPKMSKADLSEQEDSLNAAVEQELAEKRGQPNDQQPADPQPDQEDAAGATSQDAAPEQDLTESSKTEDEKINEPDEKKAKFFKKGKEKEGVHLVPDVMADQVEEDIKDIEEETPGQEEQNAEDLTQDDASIEKDNEKNLDVDQQQDEKKQD